jgi:hypothetical protein
MSLFRGVNDTQQALAGLSPETIKQTLGLEYVDNTSDLDKPISNAVQNALDQKQDVLESGVSLKTINGNSLLGSGDLTISGGGTGVTDGDKGDIVVSDSGTVWTIEDGTLTIAKTNGLQTELDAKANQATAYTKTEVDGLVTGFLESSDIGITVQPFDENTAKTDVTKTYTAPQRGAFTTVTAVSGTHTLNMNAGQNFLLTAVTGVNTITASNIPATAQYGSFEISHSGSATQSLAWNTVFKFQGTAPTLPSTAGRYQFYYEVNSAGNIVVTAWGNIT